MNNIRLIFTALICNYCVLHVISVFTVPDYKWKVFDKKNVTAAYKHMGKKAVLASDLIGGQPVYISIASISTRIAAVEDTIKSLLNGDILPTHIYVMISDKGFMKDKGIPPSNIPNGLIELANSKPVSIVYTTNIGPHRKLLPILSKHWNDDCIIVTMDDDVIYPKSTLAELIKGYILSGRDSVIALRSHRIGLCSNEDILHVLEYKNWPLIGHGIREMLQLPTGTGGVLYRPEFFHPIVFDKKLYQLTITGDDITFRLACMVKDIPVVTACRLSREVGGVNKCPDTYLIKNIGGNERLIKPSLESRTLENVSNISNITTTDSDSERRQLAAPGSLWALNRGGRNDLMWNNAVKHIEKLLEMNFFSIYNFYFLKERSDCISKNKAKKFKCGISDRCPASS
eukprot:gene11845-24834_t